MPRRDRTQRLQPRSTDAQIDRWEPTMENIMKDMRQDAISYPERVNYGFYSKASTPGGMENYFLPRGDVVELEKGIGPMWQRFLDRFRGPDGFEFGLPKYNSGGIAGLPEFNEGDPNRLFPENFGGELMPHKRQEHPIMEMLFDLFKQGPTRFENYFGREFGDYLRKRHGLKTYEDLKRDYGMEITEEGIVRQSI